MLNEAAALLLNYDLIGYELDLKCFYGDLCFSLAEIINNLIV